MITPLLDQLPTLVRNLFDTAITSGGLTAILLILLLPEERTASATESSTPVSPP